MKKTLLFTIFSVFTLTSLFSQSLITNYNFEDGKTGWGKFGTSASSFSVVDDGTGSNNVAKMTVAGATGTISDANLRPDTVDIDTIYSYHYQAKVRAVPTNAGEVPTFLFKSQILKDGSNVQYFVSSTFDLTANTESYNYYFPAQTKYDYNQLRPWFQMGAVDGEYYFDDFIVEINQDIPNGGFEDNYTAGWWEKAGSGTIEKVSDPYEGQKAMKITVTTAGNAWDVQIGTLPTIKVEENTEYALSLFSKTENGTGLIKATVNYYSSPSVEIGHTYLNFGTPGSAYEEIQKTFTTPAGTKIIKVTFNLGTYADVIYLDNISVKSTATAIKPIKEDNSVKVYPNPANDVLYVSGLSKVKNVEVCDLAGRKAIGVNEMAGDKIDVSSLKKGVYLVKVTTDSGTKIVKVIKK